jgi:hypothetical protein
MWRQSRLTYGSCGFFSKCLLGSSAIFTMADDKEQRVCEKFFFLLLGKSAAQTVLILQEALSKTQVYD